MIRIESFASETLMPDQTLGLHRHENAYLALVMEGDYHESGLEGRHACRRNQIVVHPAFHAHADRIGRDGARIINMPISDALADHCGYAILEVGDAAAFQRQARTGSAGLAGLLRECGDTSGALSPPTWLAEFACDVLRGVPIARAARRCGRSLEHASRTCKRWFAMTPVELRHERRLREAIERLRVGEPLAEIALACGFCDQPHLTRVLKAATGRTPARFFRR